LDDFWALFWVALASALVSGGFVLGGVLVTSSLERRRQRDALREGALSEQRDLVVAIIVAGQEWQSLQLLMVPLMSRLSDDDLLEFASSDTATRLGRVHADLTTALIRARLFLAHEELVTTVVNISTFVDEFPEEVNLPILQRKGDLTPVSEGLQKVEGFGQLIKSMEAVAAKALRSNLWSG
jgi:hypothetical protein